MTTALATHLWQSTLCVGVAALVALVLRNNEAGTRYRVWLAASIKFLIPFGVLTAIGRRVAWDPAAIVPQAALTAAETLAAPFAAPFIADDLMPVASAVDSTARSAAASGMAAFTLPAVLVAVWLAGVLVLIGVWCRRWLHLASIVRAATPLTDGREAEVLRRLERAAPAGRARGGAAHPPPLLASHSSIEPGVVGWIRPVILWPSGIGSRMSDEQIEAILLHELAHVRRRDNLLALVHMSVQAIFWFHPAVWWVGARLVDERERACDEEVVRRGVDPHQYAESVLTTCEYAVESPLPCVAGVTGADLKRRVMAIVSHRPAARLGGPKRVLLAAIALFFAVGPMAAGALSGARDVPIPARWEAASRPRQFVINTRRWELRSTQGGATSVDAAAGEPLRFEVASIKRIAQVSDRAVAVRLGGGEGNYFRHTGSIRLLIQQAYQIPFIRQLGGPDWIRQDNYSINAKIPDEVARTPENTRRMVRALLAERFKLVVREEEQELPIFVLVHARGDRALGPGLQPFTKDCPSGNDDPDCRQRMMASPSAFQVRNGTIERFTELLQSRPSVGRPVVDRTGLTGRFNIDVAYAPDEVAAAGASDLPSLFTALQEQLGLELEPAREKMPVVVIQRIERPTED